MDTDIQKYLLDLRRERGSAFSPASDSSSSSQARCLGMGSVSASLRSLPLAKRLCRSLARESGRRVLLVELSSNLSPVRLSDCFCPQGFNGDFHFHDDVQEFGPSTFHLRLGMDAVPGEYGKWVSILRHFKAHYEFVVFCWDTDVDCTTLTGLIRCLDRTLLLVSAGQRGGLHCQFLWRQIRRCDPGAIDRLEPWVCLGANQSIGEVRAEFESRLRDFRLAESGEQRIQFLTPRWIGWRLRSLARELTGRRVGLALSAGGAKGLAHIGVIQVLEENGIEIDVVAGCSMGAYVAAVWAYGHDGSEMERLARQVEGRWGFLPLLDPVLPPREGFMRGDAIRRRLEQSIGDAHFADLPRPLRVTATRLDSLECVVFDQGRVAPMVHGSCAIPGVFVPVTIAGKTYVDGGISDRPH